MVRPQDVLQVLRFRQLACQREASLGVFLCELNRSLLSNPRRFACTWRTPTKKVGWSHRHVRCEGF